MIAVLLLASATFAQWSVVNVGTEAGFRGLSVVSSDVIWASGTGGTVARTVDGGRTWNVVRVPGAEKIDFRDIEAFDATTAYIISIGEGESSRIYKTVDGGRTWSLQHQNRIPEAFFDAMAFWDRDNGVVMSDPVRGYFHLLRTSDGGKTWNAMATDKMFPAEKGEAAFAASGTCLVANGKGNLWMVTGGSVARVHYSVNRGASWLATRTEIVSGGPGRGIFSISMFDSRTGVIVGGDYTKPDESADNVATTSDGGRTWMKASGLGGYRSGSVFVDRRTVVAVGTNGSDISRDGGKTWTALDKENYNAVQAKGAGNVWAVGPRGRVARLDLRPRRP